VASGSEQQIVEGLPALFPVWSPAGDWIAFVTQDEVLYVVHPDGSDLRQLSSEVQDGIPPSWSPDGQRIAFITSHGEIGLINADGSADTVLTDFDAVDHGNVFYMSWSPAGDQIAADVIVTPFAINVFVIDVSTGETRNLTPGDVDSTYAAWTPDGNSLIYQHFGPPEGDGMLSRVNVSNGQIEPLAMGVEAVPRPE
jgi:Tol biopolymer transport system component